MTTIPRCTPLGKAVYCKSLADLARALQMSLSTLKSWSSSGLLRPTPSGKWSSKAVEKIYIAKEEAQEEVEEVAGGLWLEKLREHRAKLAELDLKQRRGELMDRETVVASWLAREGAVKRGMMRIPKEQKHRLGGLSPDEIESRLSDAVAKAMNALAGSDLEGAEQ